jgi:hypothetical protein
MQFAAQQQFHEQILVMSQPFTRALWQIWGSENPHTFPNHDGESRTQYVVNLSVSLSDLILLVSSADSDNYKLARYARVICSPTDSTPSTKRLSRRWRSSTMGSDNFLTSWLSLLAIHSLPYNTTIFSPLQLCKGKSVLYECW